MTEQLWNFATSKAEQADQDPWRPPPAYSTRARVPRGACRGLGWRRFRATGCPDALGQHLGRAELGPAEPRIDHQ
jgi:hypothetical protein